MKIKLTAILLILCLILSACSLSPRQTVIVDRFLYFRSQEDLEDYLSINDLELRKDFIPWDTVSLLGNISNVVTIDDSLEEYTYTISPADAHTKEFLLTIEHTPTAVSKDTPIHEGVHVTKNMCQAPYVGKAIIKRCDLHYHYTDGTLDSVYWSSNGIKFTLSGEYLCSHASTDKPPECIIAGLLSADETVANAAFAEITEKLSK